MKLSSLHGLEKATGPLFLIVAREPYDREAAEKILLGEEAPTILLGETARGLIDELESNSLFAPQRTVLLRGAERLPTPLARELASYCEQPNPAVTLIMTAATRPNPTLYKKVESGGVVIDVAPLKPWEQERALAEWLSQEARQRGKSLTAAPQLVRTAGTDRTLLIQELEKLITYVGDNPTIDAAAVAAIAVGLPTEAVWGLGQAILARDARRALAIRRDLTAQGVASLALVATLRSQIHKAYTLASLAARGATRQEMAHALPQLRDKALYRTLQEAQAYGLQSLKSTLLRLSALDLQLKNQSLPETIALDHVISIALNY